MNKIINNFWRKNKWFLIPYYWWKWYSLSFVEEVVMNEDYKGYIAGRVEVWTQWSKYDVDELRFLTNKHRGYYELREKYELKDLSWFELRKFKKEIKQFYE